MERTPTTVEGRLIGAGVDVAVDGEGILVLESGVMGVSVVDAGIVDVVVDDIVGVTWV